MSTLDIMSSSYSVLFPLILLKIGMGSIVSFISGTIVGAFIAQNYQLPDVGVKVMEIKKFLETIEEKNKKNNK